MIRTIQFGIGAMGGRMAQLMLKKKDIQLVGAVSRSHAGKDLGEVIGKRKTGVRVYHPEQICKKVKADVMVHAAVSYLEPAWQHIKQAIEAGMNVVSISEELGYPYKKYPKLSKDIDRLAKKQGVTVLGTGINPGFMMDLLPITLSGICQEIDSIKISRMLNFSVLGPKAQKHKCLGCTLNKFASMVKKGELPLHVGLPESAYMIADTLGWKIKGKEVRKPVKAGRNIKVERFGTVKKGETAGYDDLFYGYVGQKKKLILEEKGRVDSKIDYTLDIEIKGTPNIKLSMNVPSTEYTTPAHAVNLVPIVMNAEPGLKTMKDLIPAYALRNK
jgi:2,4-diaminopentanoate dehydrogenase